MEDDHHIHEVDLFEAITLIEDAEDAKNFFHRSLHTG